jgi:Protein of unknown function (DUF2846)
MCRHLQIRAYLAVLVFLCAFSGCGGNRVRPNFQLADSPPPGKVRIYVYRYNPATRFGDASVFIDGKVRAKLANRQYVTALLDPGVHEIEYQPNTLVSYPPAKLTFAAESNKTYYLFLAMKQTSHGPKLTGNPAVPFQPDIQFDAMFERQEASDALLVLKECSAAEALP